MTFMRLVTDPTLSEISLSLVGLFACGKVLKLSRAFVCDFYSSSYLSCLLGPAALLMCIRGAIYLIDLQESKIEESSHIEIEWSSHWFGFVSGRALWWQGHRVVQLKLQSLSDIGMSKALSSTVTMNIVFFAVSAQWPKLKRLICLTLWVNHCHLWLFSTMAAAGSTSDVEAAGPGSEVVAAGSSSDDGFDPTAHYSGQSDDDADPWEKSDELLISTHERMIRAMTIIPRLEVFLGWQKYYLLAEPQITCWHCWPAFQCQGWNIKPLGWAATSDFHRQVKCDLLWIHCPINFVYWVTAEIWNHSCEFNHCHWNTGTWNG